jgi:hypothetical protein
MLKNRYANPKKIRIILRIFLFSLTVLFFSCNKDDKNPSPQAYFKITNISTMEGEETDQVTITLESNVNGENYDVYFSENKKGVKYRESIAALNGIHTITIVVFVPEGAVTGKIKVVKNDLVAETESDFRVIPSSAAAPIKLVSIDPQKGFRGQKVTIALEGKILKDADIKIYFTYNEENNIVPAQILAASVIEVEGGPTTGTYKMQVPGGAITGRIYVEINGVRYRSKLVFEVL